MLADAPAPWATAFVGKWHLGSYLAQDPVGHPGKAGFADFTGSLANLEGPLDPAHGDSFFAWERVANGVAAASTVYATTSTADDAIDRLRFLPEPSCLVLSFNAAHSPLHIPPAGLVTVPLSNPPTDTEQFAAMIEAADRELGRVLDALPPARRARTTVVVVSDNGTPGSHVSPPFDPERKKGTLYDGGVRVPLLVSGPWVKRPGSVSQALVHVVDILPTIAEIAAAPLLEVDGLSFLAQLTDPVAPFGRTYAYSDDFSPNGRPPYATDDAMIRDAEYKLIRSYADDKEQFFRYTDGLDEGPDLLLAGPMTVEDRHAMARLGAALEVLRASLPYEPP